MTKYHGKKFTREELIRFLTAIDENLTTDEKIIVLGGGALALAYDDEYRTQDIDLWSRPSRAVKEAQTQAVAQTKLDVEMAAAAVSDAPYNFDERLTNALPELVHLTVQVFDEYDVTLSKICRGIGKDFNAIVAMHKRRPLDVNVLVDRYLTEMNEIVADLRRVDDNVVDLVNRLFGRVEAGCVQALLKVHRRSR